MTLQRKEFYIDGASWEKITLVSGEVEKNPSEIIRLLIKQIPLPILRMTATQDDKTICSPDVEIFRPILRRMK